MTPAEARAFRQSLPREWRPLFDECAWFAQHDVADADPQEAADELARQTGCGSDEAMAAAVAYVLPYGRDYLPAARVMLAVLLVTFLGAVGWALSGGIPPR